MPPFNMFDLIARIVDEEHKKIESWLKSCNVTDTNARDFRLGVERGFDSTIYRLYRDDILVGQAEFQYSIKEY